MIGQSCRFEFERAFAISLEKEIARRLLEEQLSGYGERKDIFIGKPIS
jgi:hypothetical protein